MDNINFLKTALDGAMMRQHLIANNIANVDTPHYKRKDVDFQEVLKRELDQSSQHNLKMSRNDNKHIVDNDNKNSFENKFKISANNATNSRNDENNVDIDYEMAELAKNNIYYNAVVQQLSTKFKMLNDVIEKGGK